MGCLGDWRHTYTNAYTTNADTTDAHTDATHANT